MIEFKAGDKVEIVTGGWGIHPNHVGKTATIHSRLRNGRYTTVETLESADGFGNHYGQHSSAEGVSFRLIAARKTTVEQIEAINQKIRDVNASIQRINTSLVSENAAKEALNCQRNELLATLMQELQP